MLAVDGLAASLAANPNNYIGICGNRCVFDPLLSDDTQATCTVPALTTTYSAANFYLQAGGILTGTWTGTASASELGKVNDGSLDSSIADPTSSGCYVQLELQAGRKGVLELFKFFVNDSQLGRQKGSLTLKGSNDGSSFT